MSSTSVLVSLPRACVGKLTSGSILFEKSPSSLVWSTPDPRTSPMALMKSNLVLDPLVNLQATATDIMWTDDYVMVSTEDPARVVETYEAYDHFEVPLVSQYVTEYTGTLKPQLKAEFCELLSGLVDYCGVAMCVTSHFVCHVYGSQRRLNYAQYKLFIALNSLYGYAIQRVPLDLAKHPLVAGPERQHLFTLFQQTGVNVYMPPCVNIPAEVCVDEVYLTGDPCQVVVAEKIFNEIIRRTDTLEKECCVSSFVRDVLNQSFSTEIEQIMLKFGTFVQLPTTMSNTVRVMGTTRSSIENSIGELVRLYSSVYCVEVHAHFDRSLAAQMGALGVSTCSTKFGTILYGPRQSIYDGLESLKSACDGIQLSVLIEQPVELMDFILGKKQGKIHKVISGTRTTITVEKCHEYNFRLRLSGNRVAEVLDALKALEGELPAEKSLYIPEVYHKQVIGQGGLTIQRLMRKHNVYMRFANTTKDKYPNAFGDSRSDNVVIRCPAKNKHEIDLAARELLDNVEELAAHHYCSRVKLTRNHRRLLMATQSNGLREIEVASGAAINLPVNESRETQLIEVSGQTKASTENAVSMMASLLSHTDYEFRVPYTANFARALGVQQLAGIRQSNFDYKVCVPLFLAMNAQVQAFEKVQILGDPNVYSQVVVSVHEDVEGEFFDDISEVVTSYLRSQNLDIVDKGKLSTELQIVTDSEPTLQGESNRAPLFLPTISTVGIQAPINEPSVISDETATSAMFDDATPRGRSPSVLQPAGNSNRNVFDDTPVKRRTEEGPQIRRSRRHIQRRL